MQKAGHSDILKSQAFEIPPFPDQKREFKQFRLCSFLFIFFRFVGLFVQFVQASGLFAAKDYLLRIGETGEGQRLK